MLFILASLVLPLGESLISCGEPLDIMFLQDTTGSFDRDLPLIVRQLPLITSSILTVYEDSRFGVAEFRDKPFFPLGQADDFCYKLNTGRLTATRNDFYLAYGDLVASGGADAPESSFQALIDVALDPAVGWSDRHRVIIINTDAVPHLPGDMEKYPASEYPELPHGLPSNSGGISNGDVSYGCLFEDYPSAYQMRDALKSQDIMLVTFTPNEYGNVTAGWRWTNDELLEQDPNYYQYIENDSSDLAQKIIGLLNQISPECPISTPLPESTLLVETSVEMTDAVNTSSFESSEASSSTPGEIEESQFTCSCPAPCPPPCADPCCNANEVMIFLKHKPSHLHMEIRN